MNYLKRHRLDCDLTQKEVAEHLGVTQSTYQRWEAGTVQIPEDKLDALAGLLKTTRASLLGRHPPREVRTDGRSDDKSLEYFGEVTFHFTGAGAPLLLHISVEEMQILGTALERDDDFIVVHSLSNQIVAIRRSAIADAYISSEASDVYGPEHGTYEIPPVMMPDPRDWEALENMVSGLASEVDEATLDRITATINNAWSDPASEAIGVFPQSELPTEKVELAWASATKLALMATYQLSKGSRREFEFEGTAEAYFALAPIIEHGGTAGDDRDILVKNEIDETSIFIRGDALDYISVPAHRWEEAYDASMEEDDAND